MRRFIVLVGLLFLSGCMNNANEEEKTIYIAAAADLYHAFTEIGDEFTEQTGTKVEYTFGATGLLTQQIQQGAPFDLFAAAHESFIDRLVESGDVLADTKVNYAVGRIVLMGRSGLDRLDEYALLGDEVQSIVIANPEHAPYGKAAQETLQSWELWDQVKEKIIYAENIRQAFQYVESGNVDVGFIALAHTLDTDLSYQLIDQADYEPIIQALAIVSDTENYEASEQFIQFLVSDRGLELLSKYGFEQPS
ncbi:molybdate ABC transporter substrate-binding protein [Bacillus sp. JCM 19034]|uniref:molybdate ABC transporter substrate-binding protein n=1 Tax=Bacillus sp. JCM 19034 TaxID=1481928 RepID=UPI000780AE37|nr:molybdate ABC transporter substrate-binding protein [Bacillus sp. JCM 19034]